MFNSSITILVSFFFKLIYKSIRICVLHRILCASSTIANTIIIIVIVTDTCRSVYFYSAVTALLIDISNFTNPFSPLRGRILKNPFLVGVYVIKRNYWPSFKLISSAVPARRWWISQSVKTSYFIYVYR